MTLFDLQPLDVVRRSFRAMTGRGVQVVCLLLVLIATPPVPVTPFQTHLGMSPNSPTRIWTAGFHSICQGKPFFGGCQLLSGLSTFQGPIRPSIPRVPARIFAGNPKNPKAAAATSSTRRPPMGGASPRKAGLTGPSVWKSCAVPRRAWLL